MVKQYLNKKVIVPAGAEDFHGDRDLDTKICILVEHLNLRPSHYNHLSVKERLVHNFEAMYGMSNITMWRVSQMLWGEMLRVYLMSEPRLTTESRLTIPVLEPVR